MSKKVLNGKASEEAMVPPLVVQAQYTKDLSFENPHVIEILTSLKEAPQISVNVHVEANPLADNNFEVVLTVRAEAKAAEKNLFLVELSYAGIFQVSPDIPKESLSPFVLIECPRLLFPFARNIIADVTRDGGIPPILLNPIDFVALYQQKFQAAALGENTKE
jgi:preprotein translocase subunit SecB